MLLVRYSDMPKPLKKAPVKDVNQLGHSIVARVSGEDKRRRGTVPVSLSDYMAAMGRKGGRIGGKRRMETMTQAERSDVAQKAAQARWKKAKRSK